MSKVVLDAFVCDPIIHEMFPIDSAQNFLPKWWKTLPMFYEQNDENGIAIQRQTMKACDGFIDLYRNSLIFPLWCDFTLTTEVNYFAYHHFSTSTFELISHDQRQYGNAFDAYIHLKLTSPWILREKQGIKFLLKSPEWTNPESWNKVFIPSGVIDFKYQYTSNINFFVNNQKDRIEFKAGSPLLQIVPLTEKNIEIKTHLIDEKEYQKMQRVHLRPFAHQKAFARFKNFFVKKNKCPWDLLKG